MNNQELIKNLIAEADELPLRDRQGLDALKRRAEMIIRKVFGNTSTYLQDLKDIDFSPKVASLASDSLFVEAWQNGQNKLVNLFTTILEELVLFGEDQTTETESVPGSISQHRALLLFLFQFIIAHYNLEDLRTLCFKLGIEFDDLGGEHRESKTRELVRYVDRKKLVDHLVAQLRKDFPDLLNENGL